MKQTPQLGGLDGWFRRRRVAGCGQAFARLLAGIVAIAAAPAPALATSGASPWSVASKSSIRLVAGGDTADAARMAGVEIKLAPNYKTYWRSPGDSGVPPQFDWSGSENVDSIAVRWPVPTRFEDGAGWSIGYKSDVLIPVEIKPRDPAKPVKLQLKLSYAVCEVLCIPAEGKAEVILPGGVSTVHASRVAEALTSVPITVPPTPARDRLALLASEVTRPSGGRPTIRVELNIPSALALQDVFLEGSDMWLFSRPVFSRPDEATPTRWLAEFRVEDRPRNSSGPVPLTLTISGEVLKPSPTLVRAVETRIDLDIPPASP